MSSIFGLWSSYMLEYCWLLALLLSSARYFTGIEGKWTPLPPISPPSSLLHQQIFNPIQLYLPDFNNTQYKVMDLMASEFSNEVQIPFSINLKWVIYFIFIFSVMNTSHIIRRFGGAYNKSLYATGKWKLTSERKIIKQRVQKPSWTIDPLMI